MSNKATISAPANSACRGLFLPVIGLLISAVKKIDTSIRITANETRASIRSPTFTSAKLETRPAGSLLLPLTTSRV